MMTVLSLEQRTERQNELNALLVDLGKRALASGQRLESYIEKLSAIYADGFRHDYAAISLTIRHLYISAGTLTPRGSENIECLQANLDAIETWLLQFGTDVSEDRKQLAEKIHKLKDHIQLEIVRMNDVQQMNLFTSQIPEFSKELEGQRLEMSNLRTDLSEEAQRSKRLAGETISLLGIFSAVVLAFNAGVAFTTSSIEPVTTSGAFVVGFIVAIVGFFLFNLLFALFTFIYRMVRQPGTFWCLMSHWAFIAINVVIVILIVVFGILSWRYPYIP